MSTTTPGGVEGRQPPGGQVGIEYIPTEEERRVFRECNQESFWYRSVPYSVASMAVTQALVARGTLSASPRFGSLPKVLFAGFFGYMAGKLSYMRTCQEKFRRLENSPLGEALRRRTALPSQRPPSDAPSDLGEPEPPAFGSMFQPAEAAGQSSSTDAAVHTGGWEDGAAAGNHQAGPYGEEEEPRRRGVLYEDLRLKNRENYEVMLSQRAETLHKPPPEESRRPSKEVKNIYGDTWEE